MVSQTINDTLNEVEHTPPVHKRILDFMPGISGGVARVMVSMRPEGLRTCKQLPSHAG